MRSRTRGRLHELRARVRGFVHLITWLRACARGEWF